MKYAIVILLLLSSMTNHGMHTNDKISKVPILVVGALSLLLTGGAIFYARCLTNEQAKKEAELKAKTL
jgi:hypothetical protein